MICFEIYINGQKVCLAGVGEDGVLSAMATFTGADAARPIEFRVGGLTRLAAEDSQQIQWLDRELSVGDTITVKVTEAESYDLPLGATKDSLNCSFCGKPQTEVTKLIAGPNKFICNGCVADCLELIKEGKSAGHISMLAAENNPSCSFCGKQSSEVLRVVGFAENRICNECIDICNEIIST